MSPVTRHSSLSRGFAFIATNIESLREKATSGNLTSGFCSKKSGLALRERKPRSTRKPFARKHGLVFARFFAAETRQISVRRDSFASFLLKKRREKASFEAEISLEYRRRRRKMLWKRISSIFKNFPWFCT